MTINDPNRRKRALGRGMGDLVGESLESLVRGVPAKEPPRETAAPVAGAPLPGRAPAVASGRAGSEVPGVAGPRPAEGRAPEIRIPDVPGPPPAPPAPIAPPATVWTDSRAEGRSPAAARGAGEAGAEAPRPVFVPRASAREVEAASRLAPTRVFAVASGKGGTGKSLLAVNLAVAMADTVKVSLIDADMGLANAHILLGLLPRWDVSHLLAGERSLDDVVVDGPRGVRLLPGASGVPEMASLDDAALDRLAAAIAPLVAGSEATVLDCPAGLSRQSLLFLHGADVVAVVTTDDLTSMTDAYALIKTLTAHRPRAAVGLVVNGARTTIDGAETYRKVAHVARKFLGREIVSLGTIPRDVHLERSVTERRPVVLSHPASASARALRDLAWRLLEMPRGAAALDFPERLRRTLAASALAAHASPRNGDQTCA